MDSRYVLLIISLITHGALAAILPVEPEQVDDASIKEVATSLVNTWIDGLGVDGLVLRESGVFLPVPNSHVYHYERISTNSEDELPEFSANIVLHQPYETGMSLDDVRASFSSIALSHLPMPGLGEQMKAVWYVTPKLPVSSFSEGVNITSFDTNTRTMSMTVDAEFFAVSGERKGHSEMSDAPMADDDYFRVTKSFGLHLALDAQLPEPLQ